MSTRKHCDGSQAPANRKGRHICLISRKDLYRITRVIQQADALTRAGYTVTVFCLGLPQEALRAAAPNARFIAIGHEELAQVSEREVRAARSKAGLDTYPYVPWSVLRILSAMRSRGFLPIALARQMRTARRTRVPVSAGLPRIDTRDAPLKKGPQAGNWRKLRRTGARRAARSVAMVWRRMTMRIPTLPGQASSLVCGVAKQLAGVDPLELPRLQLCLAKKLHEHTRFACALSARVAQIDEQSFDAVQAHDTHGLFSGAYIARRLGVPVVYDAVEILGHQIKPKERPKWLDAAHSIQRMTERPIIERAEQVITVGESLAGWYEANFVLRKPVQVVRNARAYVPFRADERLRRDCGVAPSTPLLFWCGSASPYRGLEFIVEVLAHMPSAHAALVTEFPPFWEDFRKQLLALVARQGVGGRVHILPLRPPQDLICYASGADIGVITAPPDAPLNVKLSLPNKFFEMVMARLPVAASDLDNVQHLIKGHGNGCRIDVTDVAGAAASVARLIERRRHDPALAERLEAAAHALSWEEEGRRLVAIYDELLARSGNQPEGPWADNSHRATLSTAESLS